MKKRVSKKYKVGEFVYVTNGPSDYKNKQYKIKEIDGEILYLDGYKTAKRAIKITQENTDNYKIVDLPVHISNVIGYDPSTNTPSRIGFKDGARIYKKTGNKIS